MYALADFSKQKVEEWNTEIRKNRLLARLPCQCVEHTKDFSTGRDGVDIPIAYCSADDSGKEKSISKNPQVGAIDHQVTIFVQRSRNFRHCWMYFCSLFRLI